MQTMYARPELGATPTPDGVRFALRSDVADAVEVCLFDGEEEVRIDMDADRRGVFHRARFYRRSERVGQNPGGRHRTQGFFIRAGTQSLSDLPS